MEITPDKLLEEAKSMAFEIRLLRQEITRLQAQVATAEAEAETATSSAAALLAENGTLRASLTTRPRTARGRRAYRR